MSVSLVEPLATTEAGMRPNYRRHRHSAVAAWLAVGSLLTACGETPPSSPTTGLEEGTPTLTVALGGRSGNAQEFAAAMNDAMAVDQLWLKIEDVCLQGDMGRLCLLEQPTDWIDVDGWTTLVEGVEVTPGTAQLRFIIAAAALVSDGKAFVTSAVDLGEDPPVPGLEADRVLHCPSCGQSGIKVIFPDGEPTISEGENFLVARFDAAESFGAERGNSGRWVMHPLIRGSLLLAAELTVEVTGEGTVTSSPAGIDCGDDCAAKYLLGESVTLTGTAADGWSLVGWGGDCSGSETTAVVVMDASKTCTATFQEVVSEASMSGTVSVDDNAIFDGVALPGSCGGQTVTADSLIRYFRPFISNGESHEATTDPVTSMYEITPLAPGTYNLGWIPVVPFGSEALAYFQAVVTDPDGNPNDRVTEVAPGQAVTVNYSITEGFCSD